MGGLPDHRLATGAGDSAPVACGVGWLREGCGRFRNRSAPSCGVPAPPRGHQFARSCRGNCSPPPHQRLWLRLPVILTAGAGGCRRLVTACGGRYCRPARPAGMKAATPSGQPGARQCQGQPVQPSRACRSPFAHGVCPLSSSSGCGRGPPRAPFERSECRGTGRKMRCSSARDATSSR